MTRSIAYLVAATALLASLPASCQSAPELKYVVYVSRHGVRSPTGLPAAYNKYSHAAWPKWEVAPGVLTAHGTKLMELFGAFDRAELAREGLLSASGCSDAGKVTFYADSDERTRETGNALARGLFPGCDVPVPAKPEGTNDPLFHVPPGSIAEADSQRATTAIAGRIGVSPDHLTAVYRPELMRFDHILDSCGKASVEQAKRTSLLDIKATLLAGQGDHLAEMKGPINTASTLAENMLLEYTEGMKDVGWGCVDEATVRELMTLHTAATDYTQRTPAIARPQAANLMAQIEKAMQQSMEQHVIPGALGKPGDKALFLIGHDTNLLNIAGTLGLSWIADGRRDDTPPGGALVFELWMRGGKYEVKLFYTAQTLKQMRSAAALTLEAPPERVAVFIPGCSNADFACEWSAFSRVLDGAGESK